MVEESLSVCEQTIDITFIESFFKREELLLSFLRLSSLEAFVIS